MQEKHLESIATSFLLLEKYSVTRFFVLKN